MKKIVYIIMLMMMIVISACSSQKQMTSTTNTTTTESSSVSKLDSLFQRATMAENVEISWSFDEDPGVNPESNQTPDENPIKPSAKSPPRRGSIHVTISKQAELVKQQFKAEKKEKLKQKQKTKNKQINKLKVKKEKNNLWVNVLIIIIFCLIVNFVFQHKNILKKVWNLLKKMLSLHHP